jgi:hypothetical protein
MLGSGSPGADPAQAIPNNPPPTAVPWTIRPISEPPVPENCVACHGEDGAGSQELGAPALADAIWLYGGDKASIMAQINRPQHGVMPAFGGRGNKTGQ